MSESPSSHPTELDIEGVPEDLTLKLQWGKTLKVLVYLLRAQR
jgi:hypothetical protein